MNSSSSGKRLESFLSGKGFYIVLFLCAAVIGVSAWMMAAGNETMSNDALQTSVSTNEERRVETVIIPARPGKESPLEPELEAEAPAVSDEGPAEVSAPVDNIGSAPVDAAAPVFRASPLIVSFPPAIIQAEAPITAAHRKRTM